MSEYEIDGKKYYQKKLVLGQIDQLSRFLKDTGIQPVLSLDVLNKVIAIDYEAIIALCGDNLPRAIAIVLSENGVSLKDKDLDRLAEEVKFSFGADDTMQVIEDFFVCNPIASLFERYIGLMINLKTSLMKTGSKESAPSSPEEISQSATISSGDTPQ